MVLALTPALAHATTSVRYHPDGDEDELGVVVTGDSGPSSLEVRPFHNGAGDRRVLVRGLGRGPLEARAGCRRRSPRRVVCPFDGSYTVTATLGGGDDRIAFPRPRTYVSADIFAGSGDDRATLAGNIESAVYAGPGHDVLRGGGRRDIMYGGRGRDELHG